MKLKVRDVMVAPDRSVDLKDWPTHVGPIDGETGPKKLLEAHIAQMTELQARLYAARSHAVLLLVQGLDAAGKDGVIKHVMSGVNPQGCTVHSFKQPSAEELSHDFLWRASRALPARGMIGIFNRSYYEEVLVVRVMPETLTAERVVGADKPSKHFWAERYRAINAFERHLHESGTRIIKIFLHVSKEEQKKRLLARIDDPKKNWKFSATDIESHRRWKPYRHAYEDAIAATSTEFAPWHIVPADDKPTAWLHVSHILLDTLDGLDLHFPKLSADERERLKGYRDELTAK